MKEINILPPPPDFRRSPDTFRISGSFLFFPKQLNFLSPFGSSAHSRTGTITAFKKHNRPIVRDRQERLCCSVKFGLPSAADRMNWSYGHNLVYCPLAVLHKQNCGK